MKRDRVPSYVFVMLLALPAGIISGCLETETTTTVLTDGSLTRMVELSGDSSSIPDGMAMFGIDSSWNLERKASGRERASLVARRTFTDVNAMAHALAGEPGTRVNIIPTLETHFAWFFTTYRYAETWKRLNPAEAVPLSDFLSQKEIDALERLIGRAGPFPTTGDSLAAHDLEQRFTLWENRNAFETFYRLFRDGARQMDDPLLTVSRIESRKEELYKYGEHFGWGSGSVDSLATEWGRVLGSPRAREALSANREAIDKFQKRMEFQQTVISMGHKAHVIMPGLITATNGTVEGNRISWSDFIAGTYVGDATMWAESSVTNWWTIAISGVVVLALLTLTALGIYRKRK